MAGAKLEEVELPQTNAQQIVFLLQAEAAAAFDDITRDGRVTTLRSQGAGDWPNSFRTSRVIPAVEYIRAQRGRTLLQRQMDELMREWDVLVVPQGTASLTITNLTGHPQVAVPCGFVNNMPQSIIFTGKIYEEGTPLRVAYAFEQATDWHTEIQKWIGCEKPGYQRVNFKPAGFCRRHAGGSIRVSCQDVPSSGDCCRADAGHSDDSFR